ncbi:putative transaldolase [Stieleria maiorica]|uniref:Putative transaldolase n=1 Tax=Stieleria maiorica TaxID=2795974 RepID=A0A5B9MA98_9BACT|nr:transaldolase family protein [Stieleria maiorica]QEF96474.1 putative transaldolase [Stieleria maiorica]
MSNLDTATSLERIQPDSPHAERIAAFVHDGIDLDSSPREVQSNTFWQRINGVDTSLWVDSGDIDAIESIWNESFSGLTTNNTLLNKEVQNGTYDDLVPTARELADELCDQALVREIAFILNVRHALRLVERFRCDVSVELHTDLANDTEATLAFARRCHQICPQHFVVKIPLTPAGLIATRQLRDEGIRVNCTLGFSARQNYVATALARPSFVNVFLGRLNSYVADNRLGDGKLVGEKTTLASQGEVATFSRALPTTDTLQIAASLRDASQLPDLAGVDVITIPTKVANQAQQTLDQPWQSQLNESYDVKLAAEVDSETVGIEKLWEVSKAERFFVQQAILSPPQSAEELRLMTTDHDLEDLFPMMADADLQAIARDGKIPVHDRWKGRIVRGDLAIDSLMTLAGLASFADAQAKLDRRIREHLG